MGKSNNKKSKSKAKTQQTSKQQVTTKVTEDTEWYKADLSDQKSLIRVSEKIFSVNTPICKQTKTRTSIAKYKQITLSLFCFFLY